MRKASKRRASKRNASKLSQQDLDRARRYAKLYGITLEQYDRMFKRQAGKCALCRRPPGRTRLAVDHDHKTGRVRGLLCWFDNHKFLGRGKEDPVRHERAAKYLSSTFDGRKI